MAKSLKTAAQGLHGRGDPAAKRQVVVGEEGDAHSRPNSTRGAAPRSSIPPEQQAARAQPALEAERGTTDALATFHRHPARNHSYSSGRSGSLPRSSLSKSPGLIDSSHSLIRAGSSALPGPSGSLATLTSIDSALVSTSSSTNMGASTRSASAMASEGRESTVRSVDPSRRW